MTMTGLTAGALKPFLLANMDRAAFQWDNWTFIHIPKTAGSSFREEIANALQPDYNIVVDYAEIGEENVQADYAAARRRSIARYAEQFFHRTRFASGHVRMRDLRPHPVFAGSKFITMLRHPVARLHSDYLYRTSDAHPHAAQERRAYPKFRDFVEDPRSHDKMHEYLSERPNQPVEETIAFLSRRFTWVGLQENYVMSIKMVFMLLGMRINPRLRLRERAADAGAEPAISAEDRRRAEALNQRDFALFHHFQQLHQALQPEFYAAHDFNRFIRETNGLPYLPHDPQRKAAGA